MTLAMCLALALQEQEPLKRLEFLVGSWVSTGRTKHGDFAKEATYEWCHGRHFLRATVAIKSEGKAIWSHSGMIGWDAEKTKVVAFYFGTDGTLGWSEEPEAPAMDTLLLEGYAAGLKEPRKDFRDRYRKIDADRVAWADFEKKDGKYVECCTGTYERRKEAIVEETASSPGEKMKALEFLVGSWTGTGEFGEMGTISEENSFSRIQGGNFLRTTQRVTAGGNVLYTSTGVIGWDVEKKKYVWFHFGMEGAIGWATFDAPEKGAFTIEGALRGDPGVREYRVKYTELGADRYSYAMEIKREDRWTPFLSASFQRKK